MYRNISWMSENIMTLFQTIMNLRKYYSLENIKSQIKSRIRYIIRYLPELLIFKRSTSSA